MILCGLALRLFVALAASSTATPFALGPGIMGVPRMGATALLASPPLKAITLEEQLEAKSNLEGFGVVTRTPLVPLKGFRRPDWPDLEIFLKVETMQPIQSFKVRGAANAIVTKLRQRGAGAAAPVVVTASAGNMGQGVAFCASYVNCRCVVIVPESAPETKLEAMERLGAEIRKVPYDAWWDVIETSDCSAVLAAGEERDNHVFVHPVSDPAVVAGNSLCGTEILEDLPDVDAILVPYGGGGLSCGIGCAVRNLPGGRSRRRTQIVSCEPETAAPMALSKARGRRSSFAEFYEPSFCDGCGGKAVLEPMWPLADGVVDRSLAVPIEAIEAGVWTLHEQAKLVAEGAGGICAGAAMLCPPELLLGEGGSEKWKKVVCVVSGGGIDRSKLCDILRKYDNLQSIKDMAGSLNWRVRGSEGKIAQHLKEEASEKRVVDPQRQKPTTKILSSTEIRERLPMHKCIDSAREALVALSDKTGRMPLRQVTQLPTDEIGKTGFLATMPSYHDGYAACKVITVYPENSAADDDYTSHQGAVMLFRADNRGELALLADAHAVTGWRTAAASAVAARELARSDSRALALLGTGEQARTHFVAMLETGLPIDVVKLWGRTPAKARRLEADLKKIANGYDWVNCERGAAASLEFAVCSSAMECVENSDIVCTLTASTTPVVRGDWVKPGAHINAVGACLPHARELDGPCVANALFFCDSMEACLAEAGDLRLAVDEGLVSSGKDHIRGEIGELVSGKIEGRETEQQITVFESLGIALEDLTAARALYENSSDH